MRNNNVIQIVLSGMFIALVTVACFINIPSPLPGALGGLIHLGTLMTFIIALKYGKRYGALAGGIGAAIFDIYGGWLAWAPGTLLVRLVLGYVVGLISESKKGQGMSVSKNILAILSGAVILILGYYVYEAIFITLINQNTLSYSVFVLAASSIPGNVMQIVLGLFSLGIIYLLPEIETENI